MQVLDINGKILNLSCHTEQSEVSVFTIDISHLQKGTYSVKIGGKTQRFVKK